MNKKIKELSVTLIILSIIFGIVYWDIEKERHVTKFNETLITLQKLSVAINEFKTDTNKLPTQLEELLTNQNHRLNWNGPYIKPQFITDIWGKKYLYEINYTNQSFSIRSLGSDKKAGGKDSAADTVIADNLSSDD